MKLRKCEWCKELKGSIDFKPHSRWQAGLRAGKWCRDCVLKHPRFSGFTYKHAGAGPAKVLVIDGRKVA